MSGDSRCADCPAREGGFCGRLPDELKQRFREAVRSTGQERLTDENGAPLATWDVAVVARGSLAIRHTFEDGRRAITDYLLPGELIHADGERARLGRQISTSSDFQVCMIPRLDGAFNTEDRLCLERCIRNDANAHIENLREMIATLARLSPRERVAHLLHSLHRKLNPEGRTIGLPFPRNDIADLIGIRVETVSRALLDLEQAELIRREGPRKIRILDPDGLESVAGG
ncbi:MAG: Crp/Fnr family transcriptional regulator [Immundisolibacterales bacterium]|nr:Crp/Fnr family transcriptional regulator [Immundisolibacterales bacterium]